MFLRPLSKHKIKDLFLDETARSILKYYLEQYLSSIPEVREIDDLPPLRIPKEYLEIFVSQMLNGEPAGSGNYPVDVIVTSKKLAIDISGLSVSRTRKGTFNKHSGEKSLAQKFDSDNYGQQSEDLDDLFKYQDANKIVNAFKKILTKKYVKVFNENEVNNIYIFNFIFNNHDKEIYVSVLELNQDSIQNFTAGTITKSTCIFNDGIKENFGEIKAYKAKKRLELRLNINGLIEADCIYKIQYSFGEKARRVNLREKLEVDKKYISKLKKTNAINIVYK